MNLTSPVEARFALKAFCRLFWFFGIRIHYVARGDVASGQFIPERCDKLCILRRILTFVSLAVYVVGSCFALYDYVDEKASLLDFVRFFYSIVSYTTILMGLIVMMFHEEETSQILFRSEYFRNEFHTHSLRIAVVCNIPSFVIDLYLAIDAILKERSGLIITGYMCGIFVWHGQMATFCMYMQCQNVILEQLKQLGYFVRRSPFNEESIHRIAGAKQSIRHIIQRVNSIFGNFILIYYLKLFTLMTLRIGAVILWGTEHYLALWLNSAFFVSMFFQVLQIYGTTSVGTHIISESLKLERYLYQPRRNWNEARQKALMEARRVLRYHEYFDALLISESFVNRKATTFTFLGTSFTCVAIILQFDCDILRILQLASSDFE